MAKKRVIKKGKKENGENKRNTVGTFGEKLLAPLLSFYLYRSLNVKQEWRSERTPSPIGIFSITCADEVVKPEITNPLLLSAKRLFYSSFP